MNNNNRRGRGGNHASKRHSFARTLSKRHQPKRFGNHQSTQNGHRPKKRKPKAFDPSRFINTNPVEPVVETYEAKHTFNDFGVDARLTENVARMNLVTPSPIQDKIIPEILQGRDVIGLAETGTGKTAAFLFPLLDKALKNDRNQTLILAPTRELAIQIDNELKQMARGLKIYSTVCVGGVNIGPQIRNLKRRNHFIIATPGRLLDLIRQKHYDPSRVTTAILDEADRMLDMGFINDMRAILKDVPKDRETLFFSATMTREAEKLVHDFMQDPVTVSVKKRDITDSIEQNVIHYGHHDKFETLLNLLKQADFRRVIIFGSMKHSVERLARQLNKAGVSTESIQGNKRHNQRQKALENFKNGKARILVATDVAARGIHVDDVSHVINYDLPTTFEDYVHRIGRTGRSSKRGKALTFVPTS